MAYRKKLHPMHLRMLMMKWNGCTNVEIAQQLGYAENTISAILNSEPAKEFFGLLENRTLDTMLDVQTMAQAIAPAVMQEKINLALYAKNESVKNMASRDILEMAGHSPIEHVSIERPDAVLSKHDGKSEEDLRRELLRDINGGLVEDTVH